MSPEPLFEYIDGGAEAFLQFDFQERDELAACLPTVFGASEGS